MKKKTLAVVLILTIVTLSAGSAYSGWGQKKDKFGPTVVKDHPWGESGHRMDYPASYRPGPGTGFQDMVITTITNFTVQFYLRYVAKGKKDRRSSIRCNGKSD